MGVEKSPSAFNLRCSARETTEVVKQAGNRFCFLLSHPGKENGKLPLSLSLWEHELFGEDSGAWGVRPAGRIPGPSCVVAAPS